MNEWGTIILLAPPKIAKTENVATKWTYGSMALTSLEWLNWRILLSVRPKKKTEKTSPRTKLGIESRQQYGRHLFCVGEWNSFMYWEHS